MSTTIYNPIFSLPEIIKAKEPREALENRLISILNMRLKELKIIWSRKAFRGGLNNPHLPVGLLKKLESLIIFAEAVNWKLSKNFAQELDSAVEDIETFNPPFIKKMEKFSKEIKSGKYITHEELVRKWR